MRGFLPFPVGLQLKEDVGCAILVERAGKEDHGAAELPKAFQIVPSPMSPRHRSINPTHAPLRLELLYFELSILVFFKKKA